MAISHLCISCGTDLARVRAKREPYYQLPIVQCPLCGTTAVRRMHPIWRQWRNFLRLKTALLFLSLQAVVLATALSLSVGIALTTAHLLLRGGADEVNDDVLLAGGAVGFIVFPIGLGIWLTAGFPHWRRAGAWLAFTGLSVLLLSMITFLVPWVERLTHWAGTVPRSTEPSLFLMGMLVLGVIMLIALAGIPPARVLQRAVERVRWAWWRARRRRLRRRRAIA